MRERLSALLEEMTETLATELHAVRLGEIALEVPHGVLILPAPCDPLDDCNCVMYALGLVGMIEDPSGRPFGKFYADTVFLSSLIDGGNLVPTEEVDGALVVWYLNGTVRHIGISQTRGRAASKWGIGHLLEHGLFEIPKSYGNDIRFFEPIDPDRAFLLLSRYYGVK
jgi:hypothetical protein